MIEYLFAHANPSIKRRVKTEVLGTLTVADAGVYQEQIEIEPNIQRCLASQLDNGWFGYGFHGTSKNAKQFENQETCTKYLAEKAVDKHTPALQRSMDAFVQIPLDDPCYETRGLYIDEFKHAAGGQNLIRCACIARAGYDDVIDIGPQVQLSLDSFKRVLEVDSVLEVSKPIRNGKQRVFNDFEKWPCKYHLDILAHTSVWKTPDNIKMLAASISKLMETDRPELMGWVPSIWIGHAVGPLGGFPSQGFSVKNTGVLPGQVIARDGAPDTYQLEYIEWLARCGVVPYMPVMCEVVDDIAHAVDDDGSCHIPVLDGVFKGWGPYAGLQLEVDWKSKIKKHCDITFRALLTLHYSGAF